VSGLIELLEQSASDLEFFELVRLLEHALGVEVGALEQAGAAARVSFAHTPGLAFPVRDVPWMKLNDGVARVGTTFLGLLGTASPLADEWTEQVLYDDEDGSLRAFYDVFHHRALSLLYAAWKTYALEGGFDLGGGDALSKRLRSLAGVDGWADAAEEPVGPMAALGLADYGRAQPQTIDVKSAEQLLRRLHPELDVRLRGRLERFVDFTPPERVKLGVARNRLGEDLVYGDGCTEAEGLVRILVGPVDRETSEALMPGGKLYDRLERLTRQIFAGAVDVELEVEIAPEAAAVTRLGSPLGGRLGLDTRYSADAGAPVRIRTQLVREASGARRALV
jgi:type VI secretion system protein ImpH